MLVRNMVHRHLQDVLEIEASYYATRTAAGLLLPSHLSWGEADYINAISESNQLALIAEPEDKEKAVGVLVYARPPENESLGFDVLRLVAHPLFELDFNIRRALLGHMVLHAQEDVKRKRLRVFVNGDDIETIRFMESVKWGHSRLKDAHDTWLYSFDTEQTI